MTQQSGKSSKRIVQFKLRLTVQEKRIICQKAKEEKFNSVSDFSRERLLKDRLSKRITVSDDYIRIFRTMDYNLTKVGTNLNQIAHKLNAYNTYILTEEDKEVFKNSFGIVKSCFELLDEYLHFIK